MYSGCNITSNYDVTLTRKHSRALNEKVHCIITIIIFPIAVSHTIAVCNIMVRYQTFPGHSVNMSDQLLLSADIKRPISSTFIGIVANFVLRVSVPISIDNSPYKALSDGHKSWYKYDCIGVPMVGTTPNYAHIALLFIMAGYTFDYIHYDYLYQPCLTGRNGDIYRLIACTLNKWTTHSWSENTTRYYCLRILIHHP